MSDILTDPAYFEQTKKADWVWSGDNGYSYDFSDSEVVLVVKWKRGKTELIFEDVFVRISDEGIRRVVPFESSIESFIETTLSMSEDQSHSAKVNSVLACNPKFYSTADIIGRLI